tara:strand:- start:3099 stop:5429 length:2331 start_codon:yes stop_codon:yes gene_type:complete
MANKSVGLLTIAFGADLRGFERAMKKAQRTVKKFGASMQRTGRNLTRNITLPVIGLGTVAVKTFADFEQSMLKVKAVSGATDAEFKTLTETAKKLGASTMFTASQVADLQFELAKLGFSSEEINASTESILQLSQATTHDLAESGAIVASTMKSFSMEASEASKVADIFALASSNAAMDMTKLSVAMPTVGATASAVGVDLEELTAQMMVLADRGIEASTMGTHLRKIFVELSTKGISFQDAMEKINNSTNKVKTATDLFGKRAFAAGLILADNTKQTNLYQNQLKNATGTSKRMADIMDSGTNGALRRLRSAAEGLAIDIGQMLIPILMKLVNGLQKAISFFKNLDSDVKTTITTLGLMAAAIGPILTVLGSLVTAFSMLLSPVGLAVGAMVAGAVLIVKNWSKLKKPLVDTINYFIDLYNESMLVRGAVNLIVAGIKNTWAAAKFAFSLIFKLGQNVFDGLKDKVTSLGKIIKGALTFDREEFLEGIKDYGKALSKTFLENTDIVKEETKKFGKEIADNYKEALDKTLSREKIEYITEEDVDNTVSKAKDLAQKVLDQLKKMFGQNGGAGISINFDNGKIPFLSAAGPAPFIGPLNEELRETASLMDILNEKFGLGKEVLQQYGETLGQQLSQGAENMKEYAKHVKNSIRDTIGAIIAQGVSVAITKALQSAAFLPLPLIPVVAGLASGLARTAFNSLIPAFANGGLVTGPTLGLVGEGAGITASNPEVIAPLNMLKNHLNGSGTQQVEVYGRISGNDIFISNQRGGMNRQRSV